jgi:hypothetical protein
MPEQSLPSVHIFLLPFFMLLLPAGWAAQESQEVGKEKKDGPIIEAFFPRPESIDPAMQEEAYTEYDRGSLFDYINGGAEVYLDLDFVKVGARDYVIDLGEETYFTLDVYDMCEPVNAFGIYSAERYGDIPPVKVGVEGYMGGGALVYWSGRYYVKVRADDEGKAVNALLMKMARHVANRIGEPGRPPAELQLFPKKNRVKASEKYAARNLLGHGFLKGFSCKFKEKAVELTLYLCHYAAKEEAIRAEKGFLGKLKPPAVPAEDGNGFVFDNKYYGRGRIVRVGNYLGIVQITAEKGKKPGGWAQEVIHAFFERIGEAAMKEKTDNALKALMGGDAGDR